MFSLSLVAFIGPQLVSFMVFNFHDFILHRCFEGAENRQIRVGGGNCSAHSIIISSLWCCGVSLRKLSFEPDAIYSWMLWTGRVSWTLSGIIARRDSRETLEGRRLWLLAEEAASSSVLKWKKFALIGWKVSLDWGLASCPSNSHLNLISCQFVNGFFQFSRNDFPLNN